MITITPEHVAYRRKIGKLGTGHVVEVATTGGLYVVSAMRNGQIETLGMGPHRAVARHLAKKKEPLIVLTDLAKADHVPFEYFEWLLPKYEALTDRVRALEKSITE